jgi:hypothetical protein
MPWDAAIKTMGSMPVQAYTPGHNHELVWKDDRYEIRVYLGSDYTVQHHEQIDHRPPFPWLRWIQQNLKAWTKRLWR